MTDRHHDPSLLEYLRRHCGLPGMRRRRPKDRLQTAWSAASPVVLAVVLAVTFRVTVAQAYVVEGSSMEPTLADGERLVVATSVYGLSLPWHSRSLTHWALPEPGDVVIFQSEADGQDLVKRVVGVPGDVIEVRDDRVFRNGRPLAASGPLSCGAQAEPTCADYLESNGGRQYRIRRSNDSRHSASPRLVVPPDHVFVLGDHRDRSNDSRYLGPIHVSSLRGRVVW